jgi:hypothetical protein
LPKSRRHSKRWNAFWPCWNPASKTGLPYIYQSRRDYRQACDSAGKSGKQIEGSLIATFRAAESLGFKGDFR